MSSKAGSCTDCNKHLQSTYSVQGATPAMYNTRQASGEALGRLKGPHYIPDHLLSGFVPDTLPSFRRQWWVFTLAAETWWGSCVGFFCVFVPSEADIRKWGSCLLVGDQPALDVAGAGKFLSMWASEWLTGTPSSPADACLPLLSSTRTPLAVAAPCACFVQAAFLAVADFSEVAL